jgi:hypothetical protein
MEMSEAKNLLDGQQLGGLAAVIDAASNVVLFPGLAKEKPPPLSDHEIETLRRMIQAFAAISSTCPIARKAVQDLQP